MSTTRRQSSPSDNGVLSRERMQALALLAITAILLYLCYLISRPLLPAIAWALALAVIAWPMHARISRRVARKDLAALLSVAIVAALIVAPAIFVIQQVAVQAAAGLETMKNEAANGGWRGAVESNPRMAEFIQAIERHVDLRGELQRAGAAIMERAKQFVTGSVWALAELCIALFTLFFLLRDRPIVMGSLRSVLPLSDEEIDEVFQRVADTIDATIFGTLVVALIQGALGGLIFWWLGLPGPLLWGVVMALLAIVPVFGAFIVWIPAAAYLALQGSWGKAIVLTVWGTFVIGLIDNLLYPMLVGKKLRLHTVTVFVAIVGGLSLFGASGLILGPVTVAVTIALVNVWRSRTAAGRTADAA